jgi:hypothetical protein
VSAFIAEYRERFGVEPICRTLGVSASAYERATGRRSARRVEDERLLARIREVHEANYLAYGSRRMWKALRSSGESVGRDRVARLMRARNSGRQAARQAVADHQSRSQGSAFAGSRGARVRRLRPGRVVVR